MGELHVSIHATVDGKHRALGFVWSGDAAAVSEVEREVEQIAAGAGLSAMNLTESSIHHLPMLGIPPDPDTQRLQRATPPRPGLVRDYIVDEIIQAKVDVTDAKFTIALTGQNLNPKQ